MALVDTIGRENECAYRRELMNAWRFAPSAFSAACGDMVPGSGTGGETNAIAR